MTLRMAVPNKGRLNERAVELLIQSGLDLGDEWGRKLVVRTRNQDMEILFVRAQDIPRFVASGAVDIGITGQDQVAESKCEVKEMLELEFGHCRLSVAVPEAMGCESLDCLPDKPVVATSFPNLARDYFKSKGKEIRLVTIGGAAEIMPYLGVADAIVDLVSTGTTLKTNRLVEISRIMESQAVAIACPKALKAKGEAIADVVESIDSVIQAEKKKYLMADVPVDRLDEVRRRLPGIEGPTVMDISGRDDMVAIHVVVDKLDVFDAVNDLKKLGARGILIMPINRMVP
ncbi:MAG: ATP phosphoribosyltransferase [Thermoplasmatales archaeon]|nr:ATP phosphoribosyltransferase [Thermoplasmatales archaeon]